MKEGKEHIGVKAKMLDLVIYASVRYWNIPTD
jgi:hypothetical protein